MFSIFTSEVLFLLNHHIKFYLKDHCALFRHLIFCENVFKVSKTHKNTLRLTILFTGQQWHEKNTILHT